MSSIILTKRGNIFFLAVLFLTAAGILAGLDFFAENLADGDRLVFMLLNGLLFLYLSWEVYRIAYKERWRVLLHPAVLASFFLFMMAYIFPNLRHLGSFDWQNTKGAFLLMPEPYRWLNTAIVSVMLAAFAMWRGYRSHLSVRLSLKARRFVARHGLIRDGYQLNFGIVYLLIFFAVAALYLRIRLGVFGYSSEAEALVQTQSVGAFIKLGADCGPLVLLVLSMAVFSRQYSRSVGTWLLFIGMLCLLIALGFLSGFKSQVATPVIITGFGYYVARHRVPYKLILAAFVLIIAAYQVIEPFREARYDDASFNSRSLSSIAETMVQAVSDRDVRERHSFDWMKFVARNDLLTFTAVSVAYQDKYGSPPDAPAFRMNILLSPLHAFIPRFIWKSKPTQRAGYWFNVNVLGTDPSTLTSVGMGPVSYCYFGGGYVMIFVVFWIIGLFQRLLYEAIADSRFGGWIIYLVLLKPLVMVSSNIGAMFAGFFRVVPFIILAQYLLVKGRRLRTPAASQPVLPGK